MKAPPILLWICGVPLLVCKMSVACVKQFRTMSCAENFSSPTEMSQAPSTPSCLMPPASRIHSPLCFQIELELFVTISSLTRTSRMGCLCLGFHWFLPCSRQGRNVLIDRPRKGSLPHKSTYVALIRHCVCRIFLLILVWRRSRLLLSSATYCHTI